MTVSNTRWAHSSEDLILESDDQASGSGDVIIKTGGVERARIAADGTPSGTLASLNEDGSLKGDAVRTALGGSRADSWYDPRLQWLGASLNRMLVAAQQSVSAAVLTDSTGNDVPGAGHTGDWPYEFAAKVAAAYPAWTVRMPVWNDTNQDYDVPTVFQTGTAGERYMPFTLANHTLQIDPTGITAPTDLDVSAKASLDDWTPGTAMIFVGRAEGAGARSWWFYVDATTGKLGLIWTADGTNLTTVVSSVAPTVADGAVLWVRATLDVDDGLGHYVVKFYTSTDGVTWTQLGTTITGGATTSVFDPGANAAYTIGGRGTSSTVLVGKLYEVRVRSGLNGGLILPSWPEQWVARPASTLGPSPVGAPVFTLFAGAMPGQGLTYLSNATRLPLLLPDSSLRAVFLATSHNDGIGGYDSVWLSAYSAWITAVKSRAPDAAPVVMTQNPEEAGTLSTVKGIFAHEIRRQKLLTLAQALGLPSFDACQAFLDTGEAATYVNADGIHPILTVPAGKTYSGAQIWANDLYTALFSATHP